MSAIRVSRTLRLTARASRPRTFTTSTPRRYAEQVNTTAATSSSAPASGNSAIYGGLIGGGVVLLGGYAWYHFSGAKQTVNAIGNAKDFITSSKKQLSANAPSPGQATQWIKDFAGQWAAVVPGGTYLMNNAFGGAFEKLEEIEKKHGKEFNEIVSKAYKESKDVINSGGLDTETIEKLGKIIDKYGKELGELAKDIGEDVFAQYPELQKTLGYPLKQLKELGEKQGGEAKKYADEAHKKVEETVKKGKFDKNSIQDIIQDALGKAQGLGDQAYKKAMEKAAPLLEKSPELKKLVDEKVSQLSSSDFKDLIGKLGAAVKSGDTSDIKKFLEQQGSKAQGLADQAWKAAMARADIYLDKHPELKDVKKLVEEKGDKLRKMDFEKFMDKLRESVKSKDPKPVTEFVEGELKK